MLPIRSNAPIAWRGFASGSSPSECTFLGSPRYPSGTAADSASEMARPLQEAFILTCRRLDDLKDPGKFPAWLHTIARNVARKVLRQKRLERERLPEYELRNDLLSSDLQASLDYRELKVLVNSLAPPDRAAVTLFYLAGMELNRIAEQLGIPVGTAKSRLHRSRRLMRERIRDMARKSHEPTASPETSPRDVIGGMRGLIKLAGGSSR